MNRTVTTNQKPTIDTQKQDRKNRSIPINNIIKLQGKKLKGKKRRLGKDYKISWKVNSKMAMLQSKGIWWLIGF